MRPSVHPSSWILLPVAAVAAGTAFGQERDRSAPMIEEVIVTAQKRAENILDVPIAISAVTNEAMLDAGAAQLADFLESVPGVGIVDTQSGEQNIQIRGINSTFGNAPVGYYLDELPFTYLGNTQVPDVRTYDLERVEILRGPQGTLYGDGSIGGTIRILTKEPVLDEMQVAADGTYSTTDDGDDSYALKGMLNAPISRDKLALRLVATKEDIGGWIDNTVTGVEDENERDIENYRAKLRWMPTDALDIVLSAWHTEQEAVGDSVALEDWTTFLPAAETSTEYDLYSATIRYDFAAFSLVSATSWMDYANDELADFLGAPFTTNEEQEILSEELRLTSNSDGFFRWTAGFFYRTIERDTFLNLEALGFVQDQHQESDSWAVFGEGTFAFLDDKLEVTLGLRYFEDDRLFEEELDPVLLDIVQSIDPSFTGKVDTTFDSTNPRLNIAYRPNADWMFYTNIAKGFRTGQAQPVISLAFAALQGVTIPTSVEPEEMWSYEIGTKGVFADGAVTFEGAVFYNDWQDIQVLVVLEPVSGLAGLINGGTAETMGVELALGFAPIDGLDLRIAGSYVDAEYTEDIPGTPIVDGDPISGVPDTTVSATGTYRWPMGATWNGFVRGAVQYTSEREDVASGALPSDSTTRVDLRLGVEGNAWGLYLFGDNLTNEDGAVGVRQFGPDGPATRLRPRTYGINFRYNYN